MTRDAESTVDLHGLDRAAAIRRLEQALHTARVRGASTLLVVTGRGFGNREQRPVLRTHVEAWLAGPDGRRQGVVAVRTTSRGGALELKLR